MCRAAPEPFQQAAMLALGFCNAESVGMLLEEIQPLIEEYSSTKTSVSAQALEVNTSTRCSACVLGCIACSLAPAPRK